MKSLGREIHEYYCIGLQKKPNNSGHLVHYLPE